MSGNVGQALLGHPIEGELGLWFKTGKVVLEPSRDLEAGSLRERRCKRGQGADEAEVLEGLGSQLSRDSPHFVETGSDGLLAFDKLVLERRRRFVGDAFELKEDASHCLPNLVVEPSGDPQPLRLLCSEGPLPAFTALALKPVQHLVEGVHEIAHFSRARGGKPLPRTQKIDMLHAVGKPLERGEAGPEKNKIGDNQRNESCDDNCRLEGLDGVIDLDGRKEKQ
jgi:hypothetical protein